jgi:hypothetical protein
MLLLFAMLSMVVTAPAEAEFVGCYKDGITELIPRCAACVKPPSASKWKAASVCCQQYP